MISKMVATLVFLLFVASRNNGAVANLSEEQNLRYKPPVNEIQLDGGEIADCIDFYKQPSSDHPLLKDHKIQMPPESYAARRMKQLQAMPKNKVCPLGTIPILRTTKENQAIARALNHSKIYHPTNRRSHQVYLYLDQRTQDGLYRGGSGFSSIYNFTITTTQHSSAFIRVRNGPNYIIVGWIVGLFGDSNPRLFIFWSADDGKTTGCYNLFCKGFVQLDRRITLGQILEPVSVYGGPSKEIKIKLFQDPRTECWEFHLGKQEILVGYWPIEILPTLKDGAELVAWGGESYSGDDGMSPPMGSGHKPDGYYNHSAYIRELIYFDGRFSSHNNNRVGLYVDPSNCFGLQSFHDPSDDSTNILFGGPGGYCN